jgi:hypothetical protein
MLPGPALLLLLLGSSTAAGEWTQVLDEDGVSGYAREVPGSRVLEFRSVVVVDARIEVVGAVLRDVEGLRREGSSCTEARVLSRDDRDHYTFLVAYALPWPFQDRVAAVRVSNAYDLDHGRVIADLRAVGAPSVHAPEASVWIRDFEARFVVEYLSRERTGVVFTSRVDPAGNIPAFLANRAARSSLLDDARALREAVRKPKHLAAGAASPDAELAERLVHDPAAVHRIVANRLGELFPEQALVTRIAAEPRIRESFLRGDGAASAVLLRGWGSPESRREAVRLLLREYLRARSADAAAVDRFVLRRELLDDVLAGRGGEAAVAGFLAER